MILPVHICKMLSQEDQRMHSLLDMDSGILPTAISKVGPVV